VNSPTGGPDLAQIVTICDIGEEAQIAHLELTDQARAIVGHKLVFTAIHKAARHGIHRLYIVYSSHRGSRDIEHLGSAHDDAELELLEVGAVVGHGSHASRSRYVVSFVWWLQ